MNGFNLRFALLPVRRGAGVFVKGGNRVGADAHVLFAGDGIADGNHFLFVLMPFDAVVGHQINFSARAGIVKTASRQAAAKNLFMVVSLQTFFLYRNVCLAGKD